MPDSLNPLIDYKSAMFYTAMTIWRNMFCCLLRCNETGLLVPDLAESWEVSPDLCNFTFYLYQNVTWHDGVPFNASDVKFSYDSILYNPEVESAWFDVLKNFNVAQVEILDEHTMVFRLYDPCATFPTITSWIPIIPLHLYNGTDMSTNPHNDSPVGTGPFKFVDWNPDVNITLVASEMYHRGRPYLDGITMYHESPESLHDMLLNNEIDMVPSIMDPSRIEELYNVIGVSILETRPASFANIALDVSSATLNDTRARQALRYALNVSRICELAFWGYATPAIGPVPPAYEYWCNPNVKTYEYNKTRSEELLEEAHYPRDPETGVRFNISMSLMMGGSWARNAAYMIRDYWQDVGVNASIVESGSFEYDSLMFGWIWDFNDPDDLYCLWHTKGDLNFYGYSNSTVDHLFEQGRVTQNLTLRKEIYDQIQLILLEDLPSLFLWNSEGATAYNNDFHGFIDYSFGSMSPFVLEKVWYEPTASGEGNCPYGVRFIDEQGNISGYYNGESLEEIPDSSYSGVDSDPQLVKIRLASGNYTVELEGIENGTYDLEIVNIALEYKYVYTMSGTIHEGEVRQFYLYIFPDGSIMVFDPKRDINNDLIVNMRDIGNCCSLFMSQPGHPDWNSEADIDGNEIINMRDISLVCSDFMKKWPPEIP